MSASVLLKNPKTITVQKFGGTSVGSVERIENVAKWALDSQARGSGIVVVVSAMSGETNRLIDLATKINPIPYSREYDMLVAAGEQISVGLVTLAINTEAVRRGLIQKGESMARPFLGHQLGIRTDSTFSKARIHAIETEVLRAEMAKGGIPVIAGFQGVDEENNITTLGRGGSDTSAVAIAAALKADECEIYTDVDGVYTTDPRMYAGARKISKISYEEMMELASLGAKVLQIRSVELAAKFKLPVHVRSSFNPVEGTRVVSQENLGQEMEGVVVSGVASDLKQVKVTLENLPAVPGVASKVFAALSKAAIVVDVIVMDKPKSGSVNLSFTLGQVDLKKALEVLNELKTPHFPELVVATESDLAKVSIVGVGMQHHPGVAAEMFSLLGEQGIDIRLISTSEIKISCMIEEKDAKKAVETLHRGFKLDFFS